MSAPELRAQLEQMLDEVATAALTLNEVQNKLNSLQGSSLLLGLLGSNNLSVTRVVTLVEQASHNRETLERFLFHIRTTLTEYQQVL